MKIIIIKLIIFTLFLQGSCRRIDVCPTYRLPQATQTGANTFGCRVNGKVCIPKRSGLFSPTTKTFSYNEVTGELMFAFAFLAGDKDYECGFLRYYVLVNVENVFNQGVIETENLKAGVDITPQYQTSTMFSYRSYYPGLTAILEITKLDKTNKIISGTFQFEGFEVISIVGDEFVFGDKAYISDGRFDFIYNHAGSLVVGNSD